MCHAHPQEIGVNDVDVIQEQAEPDETLHAPIKPEFREALEQGLKLADKVLLVATDPDADRMGTVSLTTAITCSFQ